MAKRKIFYKYLSLVDTKHLERLFDIIENNHLYCPTYLELDDAMEGRFCCPAGTDNDILQMISSRKQTYHICSLSRTGKSSPLWALYSNESKGCCLEVEVDGTQGWKQYKVKYQSKMLRYEDIESDIDNGIIRLITTKSNDWEHQKETRFIKEFHCSDANPQYIPISKIKSVIFGLKTNQRVFNSIKAQINFTNPDIVVTQLKWEEAALGYVED